MVAPFGFDRGWRFAVPPDALWATLTATDAYREWWPWIVALDFDGPAFAVGSHAHFVIQAPLPYRLHCSTTVVDVEPGALLVAAVRGDLVGHAALALTPDGNGSSAHLTWELDLRTPALRALARVARPAMVWGHDRIVERGLREFEQRALDRRALDQRTADQTRLSEPDGPSSAAPVHRDVRRGAPPAPGPARPPA